MMHDTPHLSIPASIRLMKTNMSMEKKFPMADGKMKIFSNFIIIEILAFVSTPPYLTMICEGSFQVGQECYD